MKVSSEFLKLFVFLKYCDTNTHSAILIMTRDILVPKTSLNENIMKRLQCGEKQFRQGRGTHFSGLKLKV